MNISDSLPYILLPFTCLSFDSALEIPFINKSDIFRALVDSGAHGTIAILSWMAVVGLDGISRKDLTHMVLCGIIACAIDLDHFIAARSYRLKDALSLDHRPPLHSTSILVPLILFLTGLSLHYPVLRSTPLLVMVSFISHHVRDGHRRGIWFWPFGSTSPLPYWLYLLIILTLPALVTLIKRTTRTRNTLSIHV